VYLTRYHQCLILPQIKINNAASNGHAISHISTIALSHKPPHGF